MVLIHKVIIVNIMYLDVQNNNSENKNHCNNYNLQSKIMKVKFNTKDFYGQVVYLQIKIILECVYYWLAGVATAS